MAAIAFIACDWVIFQWKSGDFHNDLGMLLFKFLCSKAILCVAHFRRLWWSQYSRKLLNVTRNIKNPNNNLGSGMSFTQ
jgi:hypothetical protein